MKQNVIIPAICATIITLTVVMFASFIAPQPQAQPQVQLGGVSETVPQFTTSAMKWVGISAVVTKVATSSPNRVYLEIANLSGATTTAQALYCDMSATPSIYSGFVIQASSSRVFNRSVGIPTGAIYCKYPTSSSTVSVVDF